MPEEKRRLRNELRKKLIWFGYGMLVPGNWISPRDRHEELERVAIELEISPYLSFFSSRNTGMISDAELVQTTKTNLEGNVNSLVSTYHCSMTLYTNKVYMHPHCYL